MTLANPEHQSFARSWAALLDQSRGLTEPTLARFPAPPGLDDDIVWTAARRYVDDADSIASGAMRLYRGTSEVAPSAVHLDAMQADPRGWVLFMNHAQCWIGPEFQVLREWCSPLNRPFPPHRFEKELHLISGDYSGTPFGAHLDSSLERTIHFNLGPSNKTFLLWLDSDYEALTGSRSPQHNIDGIREHAQSMKLTPRSAFVLPERWFHIAEAEGFHCTLVLTLRRRTNEEIARFILRELDHRLMSMVSDGPENFAAPEAPVFGDMTDSTPELRNLLQACYADWRNHVHCIDGFSDEL